MSPRLDHFSAFLHAMHGKRLLHLGHKDADCDALGSAYALSRILPGALGFAHGLKASAQDLADWLGVEVCIDPDPTAYDYTIICDTFTPSLLGLPLPQRYAIFDHHEPGGHRFSEFENLLVAGAEWAWVQPVESTCSLLVDLFQSHNLPLDTPMSIALACGMITDTSLLRQAGAPALRRLAHILEPTGFYIEDILAIINSPARRTARRSVILNAVCDIHETTTHQWSILSAETDSFDHGLVIVELLNDLGGDVRLVGFPHNGQSMVMSECYPALVETAGLDLAGLMRQLALTISAHETWGTRIMGRIIAPMPLSHLVGLCTETISNAISP